MATPIIKTSRCVIKQRIERKTGSFGRPTPLEQDNLKNCHPGLLDAPELQRRVDYLQEILPQVDRAALYESVLAGLRAEWSYGMIGHRQGIQSLRILGGHPDEYIRSSSERMETWEDSFFDFADKVLYVI
jgi:hypothetical protein